ncbi:D-erythrose-4-phosphate dehydrogenase [Desulfosarcina alkanivorans]|uniref:D-erythrose-4-phosphate dehydrogenase n=1 Tax=Desulfosarcina alkanivorans TaxID=571177 RepID=A0A5K7YGN4_9BACT|nr:glyceraldehyde 3-phosphate dehydrogenase NAD-binding domain-containing protein [Desulfosarcina alkanivorans]BBO68256.1 D-erythrose-4-phosphate dehydrogenase [Desulfosarcina alkanivorans]
MPLSRKPIRCAINGYGRIGRSILRAVYEYRRWPVEIVAINDLALPETIAHLTRFDSTHGRFGLPVQLKETGLHVADDRIQLLRHEAPLPLIWAELAVDVVLECTGQIKNRAGAQVHLDAGAGKVLISNPADPLVDATVVFGVNHHELTGSEKILSNASCTSNCILPVIVALDRAFGIACGNITTIHSAMNDQPVIDRCHQDLRLCRAAGPSMVPVDTRLSRGIERILPRFEGCFQTTAIRVPTQNVTAMDLNVRLKRNASVDRINRVLEEAAQGRMAGIMDYCDIPLASVDFNHDPHSCIVDGTQTRSSGHDLAKLLVWCDNEWGFANRMLDTTAAVMARSDGRSGRPSDGDD